MRWSFITDGNYINFRHTDETDLHIQQTIHRLHNTSRCIDWSLPADTTRITFTIDESKYENVSIYDIDFDGVVMTSQDDFETGVTAMFTGLAGGGSSSYLVASVALTDAQIKALPNSPIKILDAPGNNKIYIVLQGIIQYNIVVPYTLSDSSPITSSSDLVITYGANVNNASDAADGSYLGTAQTYIYGIVGRLLLPSPNNHINATASTINAEIYLSSDSENGNNFIGGSTNNNINVTITYRVLDL